jgi:D-amino-acid oxidase
VCKISYVECHDLPLEETGILRKGQKKVWLKDVVHDVLALSSCIDGQYHEIPSENLPPGVKAGMSLTTVSINTQIYLPYLQSRLLSLGATFIRRHLSHIREAFKLISSPAAVVVNATGVLASKLGGVEDQAVYPTRGQTILVRNECSKMYFQRGERLGLEPTYIIPQCFGVGTILGG